MGGGDTRGMLGVGVKFGGILVGVKKGVFCSLSFE